MQTPQTRYEFTDDERSRNRYAIELLGKAILGSMFASTDEQIDRVLAELSTMLGRRPDLTGHDNAKRWLARIEQLIKMVNAVREYDAQLSDWEIAQGPIVRLRDEGLGELALVMYELHAFLEHR